MDGHGEPREHSRAADFTVLPGVGTAIDRRLHDAGVDSYDALAADDADRLLELLAGIPSLSRDRIADWIVGAANLARSTTIAAEPEGAAEGCCDVEEGAGQGGERVSGPVETAPTFEGFTLRVVTAPGARVTRVHLQHVRTGGMRHAADLDELPRMITDLLREPDPAEEPAQARSLPVRSLAEPDPVAFRPVPLIPSAELRLARAVVRQGEPFSVEILCEQHATAGGRYTALIYARPLGGGSATVLTQGRGALDASRAVVVLPATAAAAGTYQLEALVELTYGDGSNATAFDETVLVVSPRA